MADLLRRLARIRKVALDRACLALADSQRAEDAERAAIAAREAAMRRENELIAGQGVDREEHLRLPIDGFAPWRYAAQANSLTGLQRHDEARARTEAARAGVAEQRKAVEAVQTLVSEADEARAAEALRRAQAALEDTVRPRRRP